MNRHLRVISGQGEYDAVADTPAQLPEPVPGEHRWVMGSAYTITTEEAESVYLPDHPASGTWVARVSDMVSWGVHCWDCFIAFTDWMGVRSPCPHTRSHE